MHNLKVSFHPTEKMFQLTNIWIPEGDFDARKFDSFFLVGVTGPNEKPFSGLDVTVYEFKYFTSLER